MFSINLRPIFKNVTSFIFFLLLTLYPFREFLKISLKKNIIGGLGDPLLNLCILKHNIDKILSLNFNNFFDINIFYPYKFTLAFSENLIATSLFILPIYIISKSIIAGFNIFILLNFVFSGFFMYLLCYRFTKNFLASIIAGTIFSFAPFKFFHISHIHILTTMWIPLIFLFLHKFFEEKKYRFSFISAIFFIIQSLSSANYMVIIMPFVLLMFLFYILKDKYSIKKYLISLLIFLTVSGLFLLPIHYPYLEIERLYGFKRTIGECIHFSPNLSAFLISYPFTITGKFLKSFIITQDAHEKAFYIGIIPLISIIFIFFFVIKKNVILFKFKKEINGSRILYFPYIEKTKIELPHFSLFYFLVLLLSLTLMFGPLFFKIKYLPNPVYYLFYNFFPGFKGLRVPPRFFIMFLFASSFLIAYFYSLYFKNKFLIFLESLILLEFVPYFIWISKMPYQSKIPEVYKWIREKKEDFAIMELPLEDARWWGIPYGQNKGFIYTYFSSYHNKKVFNGYSGYISHLFEQAKNFDLDRLIELAKAINIKYLIIHKDIYEENPNVFSEDSLKKILFKIENEYKGELIKVFEDNISIVYEIVFRNKEFDLSKLYIKDYNFDVHLEYKDKREGKLIFLYKGDNPCVLIYANKIYLKYYKDEKLIHIQKISINPEFRPTFLLKNESFEIKIKLPKLKEGEYLIKVEEKGKLIDELKFFSYVK